MNLTDSVNYEFYFCTRNDIEGLIKYEQDTLDSKVKQAQTEYLFWNQIGVYVSLSMFFYVLTKFIFNLFATIKLSFDKWSLIDVVCAFSNITCFFLLSRMKPADVIDYKGTKTFYNILMIILVLSTWTRLIGIMYVIQKLSKLLVTTGKMLGSAGTFMFIMLYYLVMMALVFMTAY